MNNPLIRFVGQNQVLVALALVLIGWFLLQVREVIIALFIAYIIMAALHPLADVFHGVKIPRTIAVGITYILVMGVLVMLILQLIPFFGAQVQSLIKNFPIFLHQALHPLGLEINAGQFAEIIKDEFGNISRNAFQLTTQVFGGFFTVLTTLVLGFYLLLNRDKIKKSTTALFPKKYEKAVTAGLTQSEEKLGAWVRGQFLLSISIGLITWIILTVIGLDYALPLALLAALLEIVPTIGPIIAAIPAIIVALSVSGPVTLLVIVAYILIQIFENNLLVPRIMASAVGLNPIVVIIAVVAGGKLLGILGALLSIPFITLLIIVFNTLKIIQNED